LQKKLIRGIFKLARSVMTVMTIWQLYSEELVKWCVSRMIYYWSSKQKIGTIKIARGLFLK